MGELRARICRVEDPKNRVFPGWGCRSHPEDPKPSNRRFLTSKMEVTLYDRRIYFGTSKMTVRKATSKLEARRLIWRHLQNG
eukprot:1436785-Pyramimonas_sp.AAC.1